ncbi:hypothetical protein FRC10_007050 [Ceratobasidium sp. 414]|nr:hypothetical protein FRC10_007050 [Ceratobasidium sp. 414]
MSYMYAQPTNNPFMGDTGGTYDAAASASSRFPDINDTGGAAGGPSQQWQPQYGQPNQGYGQSGFMQPQQPQPTGYMQPQQMNMAYGMAQGMPQQTPSSFGYSSPQVQYPPQQSQFMGGQYQPQMGMQSPIGPNPTGYPYQSPQQQSNYNNVADLDPYSALSNASFAGSQPQSYQPQSQYPTSQPSQPQQQQQPSQYGEHPRAFVYKFKAELEQWDTAAWEQVMLRIVGLRTAWEARKKDLNGALEGARYNGWTPGEVAQCQAMVKDAEDYIDTCHASEFQLREVQSGYRQSTDPASKRRVREALNAGLKTLPEFPQPL